MTNGIDSALEGVVSDEADGGLPGVEVTADSTQTNSPRITLTTFDGRYRILALSPGTYTATFQLEGFKTKKVSGIDIKLGETAVLNVTLKLATINE